MARSVSSRSRLWGRVRPRRSRSSLGSGDRHAAEARSRAPRPKASRSRLPGADPNPFGSPAGGAFGLPLGFPVLWNASTRDPQRRFSHDVPSRRPLWVGPRTGDAFRSHEVAAGASHVPRSGIPGRSLGSGAGAAYRGLGSAPETTRERFVPRARGLKGGEDLLGGGAPSAVGADSRLLLVGEMLPGPARGRGGGLEGSADLGGVVAHGAAPVEAHWRRIPGCGTLASLSRSWDCARGPGVRQEPRGFLFRAKHWEAPLPSFAAHHILW